MSGPGRVGPLDLPTGDVPLGPGGVPLPGPALPPVRRSRFPFAAADYPDLASLAVVLAAALGLPGVLLAAGPSAAGTTDLIVVEPETGAVLDVDEDVVRRVLRDNARPPTPLDALGAAVAAASNVPELKAALLGYVAAEKARRPRNV